MSGILERLRESEKNWKRPPPPSAKSAKNTQGADTGDHEGQNIWETPIPPSAKSAKNTAKPTFGTFGTTPQGPSQKIQGPTDPTFGTFGTTPRGPFQKKKATDSHRAWLITYPNGAIMETTSTPPATLEEMQAGHPGALVEPYAPTPEAPPAPLTAGEMDGILTWLAEIGEEDEETIAMVLSECASYQQARDYFTRRAAEG